MKRTALIAFALILTSAAAGCKPADSPAPAVQPAYATYTDPAYGYSFRVPHFPRAKGDAQATPVIMRAAEENDYAANVHVMIKPGAAKLEPLYEQTSKSLHAKGARELSHRITTIDGRRAFIIDFVMTTTEGRKIRLLHANILDKDRVILIACTAPLDTYKQYEAEFAAAVETFRFTDH